MSDIVKIEDLKELILEIRSEKVLLDADVAVIYGVESKRITEAVKNNPDKFPQDYMFEFSDAEFAVLRTKLSTTKFSKTRVVTKAFTEKGLYMIATILKSRQATGYIRDNRNFRKNQSASKKHQGAINSAG